MPRVPAVNLVWEGVEKNVTIFLSSNLLFINKRKLIYTIMFHLGKWLVGLCLNFTSKIRKCIWPIVYYYSCGLSTATIEYSCPSVCLLCVCLFVCLCVCLSVYTITQKNDSIYLKLEHIVVRHFALSDQGQGHGVTLNFFSIYHNTNCQVLYLSFGICEEVVIKTMSVHQITIYKIY